MDLKKYNLRITAFILSGIAIFLLILAGVALSDFYDDWSRPLHPNVQVDNQKSPLVTSYKTPWLLDSANSLYIIPIGHIQDDRRMNHETSESDELLNAFGSGSYSFSSRHSRNNNNLILKDFKNNKENLIFDSKVSFDSWYTITFNNQHYLFIEIVSCDCNNNGELDDNDRHDLAVYDVANKRLVTIEKVDFNLNAVFQVVNSNYVGLRYQHDVNKNGVFETYNDPTELFMFDLTTMTLSPMIDENLQIKAQEILESNTLGTDNSVG